MLAFLPSIVFAAHWPISSPALKLSVAKVMSTVSGGFGGVSSAITYRPACRAASIAGFTPSVAGVIKIPWSPRATAASIAAIWVVSSPSSLPAAVVIETLLASPASSAPFCMAMKKGLVLVLVISVTATSSPPPPSPPGAASPPL